MSAEGRKRISEYLNFQKVALIILAVVGGLRLALSLAGVPNSTVAFLSDRGWRISCTTRRSISGDPGVVAASARSALVCR